MAIIEQEFETLVTGHGTAKCNFGELVDKSYEIRRKWDDDIVKNDNGVNFNLDEDLRFHYLTNNGEQKQSDISQFGFSQLCARLGVPAGYIKKCFSADKQDLALQNFRAWAQDTKTNMLVRANDGVVRAVLSENYKPFDSYQVLRNLRSTVDLKRWEPTQVFLSEDRLVLRFVDFTRLPVNDGSPLYLGFTVTSSDVGRGSLNVKMMLYRSACTNGLLISSMGGTLYRQAHVGEEMTASKLLVFSRIFNEIDDKAKAIVQNIDQCRNRELKDYEMDLLIEKARREMKLSEVSVGKLKELVSTQYEPTRWGIINGVTELAQQFTLETRLDMENWAGEFFAKAA